MPDEVARFDVESQVVVLHRLTVVVVVVVGQGSVYEYASLLRVKPERLIIVADSVLIEFVSHENVPLHVDGAGVVLVRRQSRIYESLSRQGVLLLQVNLSFDAVAVSIFGPSLRCLGDDAIGSVEAVCVDVAYSQIVPYSPALRHEFRSFGVVSYSLAIVGQIDMRKTSDLIAVGVVGIALDGLVAVHDGT